MDADLTLAEASEVLDPPLTAKQLREIVRALRWEPAGTRPNGRAGHPPLTYPAAKIMSLHRALVDSGSIGLFFGRATHPRRQPVTPDLARFEISGQWRNDGSADLGMRHLDCDWFLSERDVPGISPPDGHGDGRTTLDVLLSAAQAHRCNGTPSEEDKIRDAMTEATDNPGRIVTR